MLVPLGYLPAQGSPAARPRVLVLPGTRLPKGYLCLLRRPALFQALAYGAPVACFAFFLPLRARRRLFTVWGLWGWGAGATTHATEIVIPAIRAT